MAYYELLEGFKETLIKMKEKNLSLEGAIFQIDQAIQIIKKSEEKNENKA